MKKVNIEELTRKLNEFRMSHLNKTFTRDELVEKFHTLGFNAQVSGLLIPKLPYEVLGKSRLYSMPKDPIYKNLIGSHTHNWDMERIPLMDRVILQVGLAEITSFPTIPIQVSINEYVEIAKYYSTPNSPRYINATLDNISRKLMADHKLIKQQPKK